MNTIEAAGLPAGPARQRRGLAYEDLQVGDCHDSAWTLLQEDEIVAFARSWDPQPFHLDAEAAAQSVFGGLCASGLHAVALAYRLYHDTGLLEGTALAGLGLRDVRFLRPLRPQVRVQARIRVAALRTTSRPERGFASLELALWSDAQEEICRLVLDLLVARRGGAAGQPHPLAAE